MTKQLEKTARSRVRRVAERGHYDRETAHRILDEGLVAHVELATEDGPVVIPMGYARDGESILLHGSVASRLMQALAAGAPCSVCVTLLDALVLARSVFHHSMNYRSVVAFGRAEPIQEEAAKRAALDRLVEHLVPGRTGAARAPNRKELGATLIVRLPLEEASVKIRSGPPSDAKADETLPYWGGLIPLSVTAGDPEPDALADGTVPEHVTAWPALSENSG